MISLKNIIWIKELEANLSVDGETRESIYPLDRLTIEEQVYRINYLSKLSSTTKFTAVKIVQ